MKLLKKASLAAAIAAAPFAAQALQPLDDATLSNATGQAGVTIEIDIANDGITIGEIEYTDEGSVALENINITNADITQTIDVDSDGNLLLGVSAITDLTVNVGNFNNPTAASDDSFSAVALRQQGNPEVNAELVNSLTMQLDMGASTTKIYNMSAYDTGADNDNLGVVFNNGVDQASSSLNAGLVIAAGAAIRIDDMDVELFGYTDEQALARADANNNGTIEAGEEAAYNTYRNGSAIQVNNITFNDGSGGFATVDQKIWAQGGTKAQGAGVYIAMGEINGTLTVGEINIGGANIGSLAVKDIDLSGMTQRIYGHN